MKNTYGKMEVEDFTIYQAAKCGKHNFITARVFDEANYGNSDAAIRLAACWNACEGISTDSLIAVSDLNFQELLFR